MTMENIMQKPIDNEVRIQALDPMLSLIVSAPAGSGKTFLLTRRILNLLMHVDNPAHVVAITFTKKAANEMLSRLISCLEMQTEDIAKKVIERSNKLNWDILNHPEQLSIMTIDSYCSWLLSHTEQSIVQPVSQSPSALYQDTIVDYYNQEQWTNAQHKLMAAFNGQYNQLEQLLIELLGTRDQWMTSLKNTDLKLSCQKGIQNITDNHINALNESILSLQPLIEKLLHEHKMIAEKLGEELIYKPQTNLRQQLEQLADMLLTKTGSARKSLNKKQGIYAKSKIASFPDVERHQSSFKSLHEEILTFIESNILLSSLHEVKGLPSLQAGDEQDFLEDLSSVLTDILASFKAQLFGKGLTDFTEISMQTIDALQRDKTLQQFCKMNIYHVLIDEFQDTSLMQYQLLESLIKCWPENEHRTLFAVGDPMQSIYRFRQADVRLFLKLQQSSIAHIRPRAIALACNFRSSSKLINQINELFTNVFPDVDMPHLAAISYRAATPTKPIEQHHGIYLYQEQSEDEAAQALKSIQLIQSLQVQHPGESIAILVQARSHLKHIIPLLEHHDLKFNAIDIYPTVNLSAIQDLSALYGMLTDPLDKLSEMIVLRSPLCGITLNSLCEHSSPGCDKSTPKITNPTDIALLKKLKDTVRKTQLHHAHPVHQTWFVWQQLCADQIYPQDQQDAIQNWFKEVTLLHDEGLALNRHAILAHFSKSYTSKVSPGATIELLTAHKSKGLEYDHVIIPHLEKRKPSSSTPLFYTEQSSDPIIQPTFTQNTQNNDYFKNLNKNRDYFESLRLLYVACTRAKSTLHLIGFIQDKPSTGSWAEAIWKHGQNQADIRSETTETSAEAVTQNTSTKTYYTTKHNLIEPSVPVEEVGSIKADIGTHLHYFMQLQLCNNSEQKWRYYLANQYLSDQDRTDIISSCDRIKQTMESSKTMQWVLKQHKWHRTEYPVHNNGKLLVIDRLFEDDDTIWIIDYKFPTIQKNDDELLTTYAQQLNGYMTAMQHHNKPVRAALYLPNEDRFIEIKNTVS